MNTHSAFPAIRCSDPSSRNPHPSTILRYLTFFLLSSSFGLSLSGLSLIEKSPFLPPEAPKRDVKAPPPPPSASVLAFRGVYDLNGVRSFNIFNKQENKGEWVKEGEITSRYQVVSFNENNSSLRLRVDGLEQELSLDKPTWTSTPVQGAPMTPPVVAKPQPPNQTPRRVSPPPRRRVISPSAPNPAQPNTQAYNNWANLPANQRPPSPPPGAPPDIQVPPIDVNTGLPEGIPPPPNFIPPPPPGMGQ